MRVRTKEARQGDENPFKAWPDTKWWSKITASLKLLVTGKRLAWLKVAIDDQRRVESLTRSTWRDGLILLPSNQESLDRSVSKSITQTCQVSSSVDLVKMGWHKMWRRVNRRERRREKIHGKKRGRDKEESLDGRYGWCSRGCLIYDLSIRQWLFGRGSSFSSLSWLHRSFLSQSLLVVDVVLFYLMSFDDRYLLSFFLLFLLFISM